jgi:integrase
MRGDGRVFKRGNRYWISYYNRGKEFRESGGRTEAEAKRFLKNRIKEIYGGQFVGPQVERITVDEALDHLIEHLKNKGAKSVNNLKSDLKPIREWFGLDRAVDVTNTRIERYIQDRLSREKRPATVNRGLQGLRQALRLLHKEGRIAKIPYISLLREDNARQGFFEKHEFLAVIDNLSSPYDDITIWAYSSAWRKSEILGLLWEDVDRNEREIRLRTSKNGQGRVLPLEGELWEVIQRRWVAREVKRSSGESFISPLVFHRKGERIADFRKAWSKACKDAKCLGKLFHDLRRTAIRNMIRAGVPQSVAMSISGHRTIHTFLRYNITSQDDQRNALKATQDHVKGQEVGESSLVQLSIKK